MSENAREGIGTETDGSVRGFAVGGVPRNQWESDRSLDPSAETCGLKSERYDLVEMNEASRAALGSPGSRIKWTPQRECGARRAGASAGLHGSEIDGNDPREMQRRGSRYGMVTMCIGGGQGPRGFSNAGTKRGNSWLRLQSRFQKREAERFGSKPARGGDFHSRNSRLRPCNRQNHGRSSPKRSAHIEESTSAS